MIIPICSSFTCGKFIMLIPVLRNVRSVDYYLCGYGLMENELTLYFRKSSNLHLIQRLSSCLIVDP